MPRWLLGRCSLWSFTNLFLWINHTLCCPSIWRSYTDLAFQTWKLHPPLKCNPCPPLLFQGVCVTAGAAAVTFCLFWTLCWWGGAAGGEASAFRCWRISAPPSLRRSFWESALHYPPAWLQVSSGPSLTCLYTCFFRSLSDSLLYLVKELHVFFAFVQ